MRDPTLWARLQEFQFDASMGSAPFTVKLARAQNWTPDFARSVVDEYRRFLYLTQLSESEVTPSQCVDDAWHMHLTFTRSYWQDLCENVLRQPLHHDPCAGVEDMPRYEAQFDATKAFYEQEFGEAPPEDIWGDAARHTEDPNMPGFVALGLAPLALVGGLVALSFGNNQGGFLLLLLSAFALVSGLVMVKTKPGKSRGQGGATVVGGCGGSKDGGAGGCGGSGCGGGGGGG